LLDSDLFPIGFEFVGDDGGETGANARSHFGAMSGDDDAAVGFETEIDAGVPCGGVDRCRPQRRRR
jgi:hypothetical protein